MNVDTDDLTPKQIQALPLLARGMLAAEVATKIDVSPQQISAWKKVPAFSKALGRLRQEQLYSAIAHVQALTRVATAGLERIIAETKDDKTRLEACRYVLDVAGINHGKDGFAWNVDGKAG